MDMKNVVRWIGVVVLPLPAYLVLQMLATVAARVLSAVTADVLLVPNCIGMPFMAAALWAWLLLRLIPSHRSIVGASWCSLVAVALVCLVVCLWEDQSRLDVVQYVSQVAGLALGVKISICRADETGR